MLDYFRGCETIEDVKKRYYELVKKYHPDKPQNGTEEQEILKVINNEYEIAFEQFKNIHKNCEEKTYTKKEENTEIPEQFKHIINKLLNLEFIEVEICGSWIWVTGNTILYKDTFKELKMRWSKNKSAWYWHSEGYNKKSQKAFTLDEIREKFGCEKFKQEEIKKIPSSI